MPVPHTFASATSTIPLSQLDSNFATVITIGNTAVQLGNTITQLNSMTMVNQTVTNYTETTVTANTGASYTIDIAAGTVQILTLTGNCSFTFPTATAGKSFLLFLKQDGVGGRTVTWPASVKWPASTPPTITSTASRTDKYVFTADGTSWLGSNGGQNYA
jgi:hypothetical protein